jgi:ribonuclease HI
MQTDNKPEKKKQKYPHKHKNGYISLMNIEIYTDGSSRGNPGPGGWGAILKWGDKTKELSGGYRRTTNNRMELLAVIESLSAITRFDKEVEIWTDSKYVVDSIQKGWAKSWEKKGFAGKKNPDLWKRYLDLEKKFPKITMHWVKGHAGHEMNERCDVLATTAPVTKIDTYYESI